MYRSPEGEETFWAGKIERLAWGGVGLATAEDGRRVLLSAPTALFPGEEVETSVRWKARHGEGEVRAWTSRDPRRVPAGCPHAGTCGGCELWEAGGAIAELKHQMVQDLFARQLPGAPPFTWRPAPVEARRHRIQLHWDGHRLGYHARHSHRIVEVQACPAAAEAVSLAIPALRAALEGAALPALPQRWELATGTPADRVWAVDARGQAWERASRTAWREDAGPVTHDLEGIRLDHRPGGFFQACPPWAVRAFREQLLAWDLEGGTLYDLYGGVGLFSALLGRRFRQRVLVEADAPAVAWAVRNLAGLPSECVAADVGRWLPEGLGNPGDLILLDPPRTGLEPAFIERLRSARASRLVLVGCDGAAFCRDVKRLAPAWQLTALAALDLFPLTHHVECVGLFAPGNLEG